MNRPPIPIEYLKQCFTVDEHGILFWRERPISHFAGAGSATATNHRAGKPVGHLNNDYLRVFLKYAGLRYPLAVHRIIWALHHEQWPEHCIDHINRIKNDNRIENLRDVPLDVNSRNNGNPHGTGLRGAYRRGKRFMSHIKEDGGYRYLGIFDTAQQAHKAYMEALNERAE